MKYVTFILAWLGALLALGAAPAAAQFNGNPDPVSLPSKPSILEKVGIDQNIGAQIPPDLAFNDEQGRPVRIGDYFGKRPIVLTLVYYDCPMLCTMVLNDTLRSARAMRENIGTDYDILTVSFDPRDTPATALAKKKTYLAQYNRPGAERGWNFLTGSQASITKLTSVVGFRYAWDPAFDQYAHASGIIILTPSGKVSRYFFGIDYVPQDLRLSLTEASGGKTGGIVDAILLYCCQYDPNTGRYGLAIRHSLTIGGIAILLAMGTLILVLLYRDSHRVAAPRPRGDGGGAGGPAGAGGAG